MQSASSRIWTRVAMSISYDDNHYTTGTSTNHLLTDVNKCIIRNITFYLIDIKQQQPNSTAKLTKGYKMTNGG